MKKPRFYFLLSICFVISFLSYGINCFALDSQGKNANSFSLNRGNSIPTSVISLTDFRQENEISSEATLASSTLVLAPCTADANNMGSSYTSCSQFVLHGAVGGSPSSIIWSTNGTGTFSPNLNTLGATYIPSAADYYNGGVTLTLTASGNCTTVAIDSVPVQLTKTDYNECTTDVCNSIAQSVSHTAINTNDNNPCTTDACNTSNGSITHIPLSNINDGNSCTTDACNTSNGSVTHIALNINDNNPCTTDACNTSNGSITHLPLSNINDGNSCTTDACNTSNGSVTHIALNINDNNPCTTDACNTSNGSITHLPLSNINDGNSCTADACNTNNGSVTHTAVNINDNNACTTDACNTSNGSITHLPLSNIDDGNSCTIDACNTSNGSVTHTAVNINDNNACTTDACNTSNGSITHLPLSNIDDGNSCTTDACNTNDGSVTHTAININDNNACTNDACNTSNGSITHLPLSNIDDGNSCTTDACNTSNGSITHIAVSTEISIQSLQGTTICAGSATFTATPTNGGSSPIYQWKKDGVNIGSNNDTLTTTVSNGQVISCVMTSNSSCANPSIDTSNSISMTVIPTPLKPQATNYMIDSVCKGSHGISFGVLNPDTTYNYIWKTIPSTARIHNDSSIFCSIDFPSTGNVTFSIIVTSYLSNCSNKDTIQITINNTSAPDSSFILLFTPVNVLVCSDSKFDSYQWGYDDKNNNYYPDSIFGAIFQDCIIGPSFDTSKYFYWVITREGDCFTKSYYNRPRVNGNNTIKEISTDLDVEIYPNPVIKDLTARLNGLYNGRINLAVFDILGKKLVEKEFWKENVTTQQTIDLQDQYPGIYFLRITFNRTNYKVIKIILEK